MTSEASTFYVVIGYAFPRRLKMDELAALILGFILGFLLREYFNKFLEKLRRKYGKAN
jgi:hypothetical protein